MIPLLNVSYEEIHHHLANKSHTSNIQQPDKGHTNLPNKEMATPFEASAIETYPTTGDNKYGLSYHGSEVLSNPLPDTKRRKKPQDQSHDEWLNDWDNA